MTPSADKRTSGNPATQAGITRSVKQQREEQKQAKLAEYQRQLAKRRRSKIVWWTLGSVAGVAVVALVVASFIFAPRQVSYTAHDSTGTAPAGVETFTNVTTHVEGAVEYPQNPPAGGEHNAIWLNCGVYTEPQANENAVHSMEHGAVWVTYDPEVISGADLDALTAEIPRTYAILSPFPDLPSPVVLSAWNAQLQLDEVDVPRITEFMDEYWRNQNVPEPHAVCSGAIDGPGKA